VLSKHHPQPDAALLQKEDDSVYRGIAEMVQKQLSKHADILGEVITPSQKKMIRAFVQTPTDFVDVASQAFGEQPQNAGSYAPRSGQIFGILKQMKETFEANLSDSQKEEIAKQKSYEEMKAAKEEEIALGKEQVQTKTQQLAETDEKLANDKQDLVDTRASLSEDEKFLMDLKVTCQMTDQEWEARQKSRQEEIGAVSKAIAILTSDEAHDLFTKTFNPNGFVQLGSSTKKSLNVVRKERAENAAAVLRAVAEKKGTAQSAKVLQLVTLISRAGSGLAAFEKVKKAIDDMVAELMKQQEDEVKKRDWCIDEQNTNERTTEATQYEADGLAAKIKDLELTIDDLTSSIGTLKSEIAEMQVQLKRAGEDREKENKEFQATVADQRATQKLLQQALTVLKNHYEKSAAKAAAALLTGGRSMTHEEVDQAPPPGFGGSRDGAKAASGGVIRLLEGIINDAKNLEKDAIKSEEDAQKAYEDLVNNTNNSIAEKNRDITNKSEEKARAEGDKATTTVDHEETVTELAQLSNEKADLQSECGFLLQNFEVRQAGRAAEIEALRQAKQILSGAKLEGFLQRK